jgi:hypothetical protein
VEPFNNIAKACQPIDSFTGGLEKFSLPPSDELQDSVGITLAIITEHIS